MKTAVTNSPRIEALKALRDIARALSVAWDLDTTLDLIAHKTTEVMQVESCSIYLLDADGETLRLRATTGLARRGLGIATLRVGEGMTGHAVAENRPVYDSNAWENPHFKLLRNTAERNFRSLLAVPLLLETAPIGALNVQTVEPHDYALDEVELLSLIADLAAGALAKARLHDSQKRQIEELRALAEVSEVVTSPQYLDDILDVVTEMAAQVMGAAACSIFLLNDEGTHLELRSTRHMSGAAGAPRRCRLGEGVIGSVAASGRPRYVRDVRAEPEYGDADQARRDGLVSLLAVPLSVREQVIGVFNCYSDRLHTFTGEQETLFLTLANQTALAIEHARLATNAAMIREMHHRIKNNLQTVAMLMRLQLAEVGQPDARRQLESSIQRVHSIAAVHETLSERGFHMVDVSAVLRRIAATATTMTGPGRSVTLSVEGERVFLPSREATSLALVANELIQNALDHAFSGRQEGHISVTLARAPDILLLRVGDDGAGLPPAYEPGLGMEIVETLVRSELRGDLSYDVGEAGTMVTIRLPLPVSGGQ